MSRHPVTHIITSPIPAAGPATLSKVMEYRNPKSTADKTHDALDRALKYLNISESIDDKAFDLLLALDIHVNLSTGRICCSGRCFGERSGDARCGNPIEKNELGRAVLGLVGLAMNREVGEELKRKLVAQSVHLLCKRWHYKQVEALGGRLYEGILEWRGESKGIEAVDEKEEEEQSSKFVKHAKVLEKLMREGKELEQGMRGARALKNIKEGTGGAVLGGEMKSSQSRRKSARAEAKDEKLKQLEREIEMLKIENEGLKKNKTLSKAKQAVTGQGKKAEKPQVKKEEDDDLESAGLATIIAVAIEQWFKQKDTKANQAISAASMDEENSAKIKREHDGAESETEKGSDDEDGEDKNLDTDEETDTDDDNLVPPPPQRPRRRIFFA